MKIKFASLGFITMFLVSLRVFAQDRASAASGATNGQIVPPGDPTWLIVVVAFVLGVVVGVVAARMMNSRSR